MTLKIILMKLQMNLEMNLKINKQTTMKRLFFTLLFTSIVTMIFAQDLKKAKSYSEAKQLDKAKTEIDGYIAKSPADAEGNYVKAKIYEQIASTEQFNSLVPGDARQEAFDA